MKRALTIVLALAIVPAATAQERTCGKADAANAQKALDRANTWPQLQKAVKDFSHCDKGETAEAFNEALMRLAIEWKHVDQLALAWKDAGFKAFATRHLKNPAAKDDAEAVYSRAKTGCPSGQDAFCAEIAEIAKAAK